MIESPRALHTVDDPSVVWYGGMGHRLLSTDDGVECYRCGMAASGDAFQELIPDCAGPDGGGDHYWTAAPGGIECAYGDAVSTADAWPPVAPCVRSLAY